MRPHMTVNQFYRVRSVFQECFIVGKMLFFVAFSTTWYQVAEVMLAQMGFIHWDCMVKVFNFTITAICTTVAKVLFSLIPVTFAELMLADTAQNKSDDRVLCISDGPDAMASARTIIDGFPVGPIFIPVSSLSFGTHNYCRF